MHRDDLNPHGIPRPSAVDLARADLDRLARVPVGLEPSTLDTLRAALDELEHATRAAAPRFSRDRVQLAGLEPCEHGHYLCAYEAGGSCLDELQTLEDNNRRRQAARALEATRAAIDAPAPILAAFLEDGTYSVGQLAAVLDVSTWTPAELVKLERVQDRDRLAAALELDQRHRRPRA